jgi:hypothetical protein
VAEPVDLKDVLNARGGRLILVVVGQLRSAAQNVAALRTHLLDGCPHVVAVQCPAAESAIARELYPDATIDGWDPPPLPAALRFGWPPAGAGARAALAEKSTFYYQLARQQRAARSFASLIAPVDLVLKWRPDIRLFAPIGVPSDIDDLTLILPGFDHHYGFNDQVALGTWPVMQPYLARGAKVRSYLREGGRLHPEVYVKWAMRGLRRATMRIAYAIDRGDTFAPVRVYEAAGDRLDADSERLLRSGGVNVIRDTTLTRPPIEQGRVTRLIAGWWQAMLSLAFHP